MTNPLKKLWESKLKKIKMLVPLSHRDFRLLWTGMSASLLGDGVFLVAVAWQTYELSNNPSSLAIVGAAQFAPQVMFFLFGGVLTDRLDRRRVMIGADLVRFSSMAGIAFLSISGLLTLPEMIGLVGLYGAGTAFFEPGFGAIVPDVVPKHLLAEANSLDQFFRPVGLRLAGPALGGAITGIAGVGSAFAFNAVSFGFSAICILLMRAQQIQRSDSDTSTLREIADGFKYVRSKVWLWGTFTCAAISYMLFMGPTEVLVPYLVKNDIGGGAAILGLVFTMGGVGAVIAAILVSQRGIPRRHMTFMYITWSLATFAIAGYGISVLAWQLMAFSFLFNAFETAGTISWATTKHRFVPTRMLGRVSSYDWFISVGLVPLSYAATGPVADAIGVQTTLIAAGIIGGVNTIAFLFLPRMRDIERTPPELADGQSVAPLG